MKLSYDPRHNIAYIAVKDHAEHVTTLRLSDEVNIDLAADGTLYGIELLNAHAQLAGNGSVIAIVNESTGEQASVRIAG